MGRYIMHDDFYLTFDAPTDCLVKWVGTLFAIQIPKTILFIINEFFTQMYFDYYAFILVLFLFLSKNSLKN